LLIVFSDDHVVFTRDLIISQNPWYIDQHLMTRCDYLIGPPSTFTLWASYVGKVPFFQIEKQVKKSEKKF